MGPALLIFAFVVFIPVLLMLGAAVSAILGNQLTREMQSNFSEGGPRAAEHEYATLNQ